LIPGTRRFTKTDGGDGLVTFWRGLVAGSILGMIVGALWLTDEGEENRVGRLRERIPRIERAQRVVRKMVKLADLVR